MSFRDDTVDGGDYPDVVTLLLRKIRRIWQFAKKKKSGLADTVNKYDVLNYCLFWKQTIEEKDSKLLGFFLK